MTEITGSYAQVINPKHKAYVSERFNIEFPEADQTPLPLALSKAMQRPVQPRVFRNMEDSFIYDSIPVYGFHGDSFILHDIFDPCGSAQRGEKCTCWSDFPRYLYGPWQTINFQITEPMDILITNVLPGTRVGNNEIILRNRESGNIIYPTKDCYEYHDYERMHEVAEHFLGGNLQSFFIEDLLPGRYAVNIRGLRATNAGTGYGRIETLVIGASKMSSTIGADISKLRIPLERGFHYAYPVNIGKANGLTYNNMSNMTNYVDFYNQTPPFYYYDMFPEEDPRDYQYRYDKYVTSYKPHEGRNVVYEFEIADKPMTLFVNSDSRLSLLNGSKSKIFSGNRRIETGLDPGKYYLVTETGDIADRIVIECAEHTNPTVHIPELGPRIETDPEKEIFNEPSNNDPLQYVYDLSGNRKERIIYMLKTAFSSLDTVPELIQTEKNFTYKIYPNPTEGNLYIEFDWKEPYQYQSSDRIEIHDRNGHRVKNVKIADDRVYIDISNQNFGIYIMNIVLANETISWKIFKK